MLVKATNQPSQPQVEWAEARQVSARICSEQSTVAWIFLPYRVTQCLSRAAFVCTHQGVDAVDAQHSHLKKKKNLLPKN